MTTSFTHAALGLAAGYALGPVRRGGRFWLACALLPVIPDADVIGFSFGISYGDVWGHRGLTHSLTFAVVLGLAAAWGLGRLEQRPRRQTWHLAGLFILLAASHGPMDMMTNGGLGIALLSPFDTSRYFWDWRPVLVSPIGLSSFFSPWGWAVVKSEVLWFGAPIVLLGAVGWMRQRHRSTAAVSPEVD